MCGIAGIFHLDGEREVAREDVARMTRVIVHRGPDDEGFFFAGPVGFGVRRLSIVDRALGHQPLTGEDGNVWIAFNGEIYNHPDLQQTLIGRGHSYRTNCDTETVVHAYEEYGERMVEHLRGMFAFALWDDKKKRLLLYRDRLGIKPLYYCRVANTLVFSSEVKALLEYGVPFGVEEQVLECYLRLGYVPGERTLFHQVYKLPPGHYLVAEAGNASVQVRRYWSPRFAPSESVEEAPYVEEFARLLDETVAQHRLGEVPQGIFLSGGVDSSSLLAITAGQVSEPVLTFSVGYAEERENSELGHARRVAQLFGARHFEYELSGQRFADSLPKLIWHMDEPIAEMAAIPLYCVAQLAREHITVVHSGEGADEILAGYAAYIRMQWISRLQRKAGLFASGLLAQTLSLPGLPYRLRRYGELMDKPLWERYQGVRRGMTDEVLRQLGRNGFPSPDHARYRLELFRELYSGAQKYSELNQMLAVDLQTWLPDDLLVKADKMTMAASIELRVPFLDHHIVEFAGSLPCRFKLNDGKTKYLLKRVMRDRLEPEILRAPKRGFPVPLRKWFRTELFDATRTWLLDSKFLGEFFVRKELERFLEYHRRGRADLSTEIYGLICLAVWHDVFSRPTRKAV
jgi:asparagine synthase (glutamine-hydrolysing)